MSSPDISMYLMVSTTTVYAVTLFIQAVLLIRGKQNKEWIWFLFLLAVMISYNAVTLLSIGDHSITWMNQQVLQHLIRLASLMYVAFYFYKIYNLVELRFYATYGQVIFLVLPFLVLFSLPCFVTEDADSCRQMCLMLPLFYSLLFFSMAVRIFISRYRHCHYAPTTHESKTIIRAGMALLCWMFLPLLILLDLPAAEHVLANSAFLLLSVNYIWAVRNRSEKGLALLQGGSLKMTRFAEEAESILSVIDDQVHKIRPASNTSAKDLDRISANLQQLSLRVEQLKRSAESIDYESATDVSALLTDKVAYFERKALAKQVDIKYEIAPDVWLPGRQSDLHRIIHDLLRNAIHHATVGETVVVNLKHMDSRETVLSVTDRGIPLTIHLAELRSEQRPVPTEKPAQAIAPLETQQEISAQPTEKTDVVAETITNEQDIIREAFGTLRLEPPPPPKEQEFNSAFDLHCWRCSLTPREIEILHALNKGHSHKKIAELYFISKKTVDTHVGNIFRKVRDTFQVQITSRVELLNILEIRSSGS